MENGSPVTRLIIGSRRWMVRKPRLSKNILTSRRQLWNGISWHASFCSFISNFASIYLALIYLSLVVFFCLYSNLFWFTYLVINHWFFLHLFIIFSDISHFINLFFIKCLSFWRGPLSIYIHFRCICFVISLMLLIFFVYILFGSI